jgi:hypothetical protein
MLSIRVMHSPFASECSAAVRLSGHSDNSAHGLLYARALVSSRAWLPVWPDYTAIPTHNLCGRARSLPFASVLDERLLREEAQQHARIRARALLRIARRCGEHCPPLTGEPRGNAPSRYQFDPVYHSESCEIPWCSSFEPPRPCGIACTHHRRHTLGAPARLQEVHGLSQLRSCVMHRACAHLGCGTIVAPAVGRTHTHAGPAVAGQNGHTVGAMPSW